MSIYHTLIRYSVKTCLTLAFSTFALSGTKSSAEPTTTPGEKEKSPTVSICLYALGDAPILGYVNLNGEALKASIAADKKLWEEVYPGKPYKPSIDATTMMESQNPMEAPPSPIVVDLDRSNNNRKFINLSHMYKSRFVMNRAPNLTLKQLFDPPAGSKEPPVMDNLASIPIPPESQELLVFIVKPPNTYLWTQPTYKSFDVSPTKMPENSVIVINLSSFPVAVAQLPISRDKTFKPVGVKVEPGGFLSQVIREPKGLRVGIYTKNAEEPFAGKIVTPRKNHREVLLIYNHMTGNRVDLESTPGMQSFAFPIID